MKRICGIRPTGKLHLGHYFSVIKPALDFNCDVLVAQYHAPQSSIKERDDVVRELSVFIPKTQIKIQELNPSLFFRMLTVVTTGVLGGMTQYKSAKIKTAQLLIYPVLMAHDVVGYDEVYVGEDQVQHLELANKILRKCGLPSVACRAVGGRIMSLSHPNSKMSKSEPKGCLFLSDSSEEITRKIKKAVTDKEGMANLRVLFNEFVGGELPKKNEEMKHILATSIIEKFSTGRLLRTHRK